MILKSKNEIPLLGGRGKKERFAFSLIRFSNQFLSKIDTYRDLDQE